MSKKDEPCYIVEDGTNDRQCVDVAHTIPKIYDSASRAQTVIDRRGLIGIQNPAAISVVDYDKKYSEHGKMGRIVARRH